MLARCLICSRDQEEFVVCILSCKEWSSGHFEDDRCIVRDRENGYSLITTGTLENGLFVLDRYEKGTLENGYSLITTGTLENGLFVLDRYEKGIQACIAETKTQAMQDAKLWHARFGHVGYGSLMTLQRHNMVHDFYLLEMPPRHVCEGCILGKMHRFAFSKDGSVRATQKLQLVHRDVCGPMRMPSVGNSLYFVTFIDDFSRFCWVYPLKAKSDVFAIFQLYVSMVENETGCKVHTLRTDRGGEYMSERKNRSLMKMARCMLKAKSLPHKLWMEAVACAAHVLNKCPTRALKTITPYESCYVGSLMIRQSNVYLWGTVVEVKPMVAFDVPHMQTQDVFEGFLPSFVENQESQQVDNFDQSFYQHVTPHDVEEIVREEQEVLREERTLPKWVQQEQVAKAPTGKTMIVILVQDKEPSATSIHGAALLDAPACEMEGVVGLLNTPAGEMIGVVALLDVLAGDMIGVESFVESQEPPSRGDHPLLRENLM
ncbi:hypothetical protein L7F22_055807 [Adiantum nelumboides]|nr:hypothetical protein [Adiantum nelumboides]